MDRHVNTTLLHKIHAIRDKKHRLDKKLGLAHERFPWFPVSRPVAAKLCELAGVRKPRPGWTVDVAEEDNATWLLTNHSGSYHLSASYH